ncbi:MAG: phosphate:Na+ symporter [Arenicella sp.]|jgi:phosphate:Na+ symporter
MSILSFLFGLAIFLYSMHQLESGIREASGQNLKKWIVRNTNTPISAAASGVMVTAILQSSSMVSLIALAFVSAGIMPLFNGIGVVLGANVGTTVTGWIVATVGFKMDLQALVPPLIGLGAAANLGYLHSPRLKGLGSACLAFGLLIFGLDIMKESVAGFSQIVDIGTLNNIPPLGYLFAGVLLAAVMQSSSAVMIIALSLLSSDLLNIVDAAALVIGADLGTTSTTVLGSFGESRVKKQLAFAHVFFNIIVNSFAFLVMLPLLPKVLSLINLQDPMFSLVAFHSTFNLLGLLTFLPLLKFYTSLIEKLIPASSSNRPDFFNLPVEVPELAISDLKVALRYLNSEAIKLHMRELGVQPESVSKDSLRNESISQESRGKLKAPRDFEAEYQQLKDFENEFLHYSNKLQLVKLEPDQAHSVVKMLEAARATVYATKTLKDFRSDFKTLYQSSDNALARQLLSAHQKFLREFYHTCIQLLETGNVLESAIERQNSLGELNNKHYQQSCDLITRSLQQDGEAVGSISTWFNLNHELHHYIRYMLTALITNSQSENAITTP